MFVSEDSFVVSDFELIGYGMGGSTTLGAVAGRRVSKVHEIPKFRNSDNEMKKQGGELGKYHCWFQ